MTDPVTDDLPELGFSRLLLVCAGSVAASYTPQWLHWLQLTYPELEITIVLTRSAERFVTRPALAARPGVMVASDVWPDEEAPARHVTWAEWAEAIVVYPATVHFMARLALGLADSPALLAAHCTTAPLAVAPALPPGALDTTACQQHWSALARRPQVVLVPPVRGRSVTTGREEAWGPPPLPEVLRALAEHRDQLSASPAAIRRPEPVAESGTGLLRTIVGTDGDGGYEWFRSPGPDAPEPFRSLGEVDRARLAAVGERGAARLVVGTVAGNGRVYQVRGRESVARRLLEHGAQDDLAGPLRAYGRLLRAVHDLPPSGALPPSPGMLRLGEWLAGRALSLRAAVVQGTVRHGLGEARWSRVVAWYRRVTTDPEITLTHGAPGVGALVLGTEPGTVDLLVGEDVAAQPWYVDLGWVVGELAELRWQVGTQSPAWQRLTDAAFEGYGRDLGTDWNRMVVLRILLHIQDFAAYAGGPGDWVDRYVGFVKYLVDL